MNPLLLASPLPLAYLAAPLCRWLAWRHSFVDRPRADRFSTTVVPKLGGLVVVLGAALALATIVGTPVGAALVVGWMIAFASGLADDRWHLRPRTKFTLQVLAAVATILPLTLWLGPPDWFSAAPTPIVVVVGVLWVTAFQNAVNFLDNMDGIAGGVAAVALAGTGFILPGGAGRDFAWVVALATVGFLPWNVSRPARLYLGDAGSLSLGHAVGAGSFLAVMGMSNVGGALAVLPVVSIPLIDLAFVTWVRLREGRSPAKGGRDHTTHRLYVRLGSVTLTRRWVWALAVFAAGVGAVAARSPVAVGAAAATFTVVFAWLAARHLATLPTPGSVSEQN